MKKILVTGGTGYIGSHTVVELISAGYEPVIVDDLSNSSINVLHQIEKITGVRPAFYQLDLCRQEALSNIANLDDIEGVIHFAAYKSVSGSVSNPLRYYKNNFYSLINILQSFAGKPVNFVFSSSCTVYGEPDVLPVNEQAAVKKAESPYGNTKQVAEEILMEAAFADANLNVIALRYFNPVGAHSSALIGELPIGVPQNLVPFITQSAIGKRGPLTVFGNDYATPDGSCIRDYIHVVDLARAHVAALKRLQTGRQNNYEVFNVGTGKGTTVLQLIEAFERVTGVKLNYTIGQRRLGDIEKIWGDVSHAGRLLNWKAGYDIDEMMRSAWAWEQANATATVNS